MNYIVTDAQLTAIADAIRNKHEFKNLCNPNTLFCEVESQTVYTLSFEIDYTGSPKDFTIRLQEYIYETAASSISLVFHAEGTGVERLSQTLTTASDVTRLKLPNMMKDFSDIQLEEGSTATAYESYPMYEFPSGFVSNINNI